MQGADAVLVGGVRDPLAVIGKIEILDVPFFATEGHFASVGQMHADQLVKLRSFIAGEVNVVSVPREPGA